MQMGPVDVNGSIHTARKQHQRKNITICARVASRVLCGLGLTFNDLIWGQEYFTKASSLEVQN